MDRQSYTDGILELIRGVLTDEIDPLRADLSRLKGELGAALTANVVLGETCTALRAEIAEIRALSEAVSKAVEVEVSGAQPEMDALVREAVDVAVREAVDAAMAAVRMPADGKDVDMDVVDGRLDFVIGKFTEKYEHKLASMRVPEDGKSIGKDDVMPDLLAALEKAVAALPAAKAGRDGIDAVSCLIDNCGHLIFTLSDGTIRDVGQVVGDDGVDIDTAAVQAQIREDIARLFEAQPKPRDGIDGLGFDDMELSFDGGKRITLTFIKGERRRDFAFDLPVALYRGVYKEGEAYVPGDIVTWGGSCWHCDKATSDKPDKVTAEKCWTLMVKKGRDGKDAPPPAAKGGR